MKKLFANRSRYTVLGSLAIMLAALLWSIDGLFIRPRFYILPAPLVVFVEHALGFLVLSPFIFIYWNKIKALSRKSWGAIIWISLFGGLIGTIMITKAFFAAFDGETTFATVVILQKLQPIFALLLARIILGEKLPKRFYAWTAIAIVASYFIAFAKTGLNIFEINWWHNAALFSFLAAFAFGSSTVFGKRIANHLDYRAVAALRFGVTAVMGLVLILLNSDVFRFSQITPMHWRFFVLILFTSGAGAMFVYYFGLRRVSASASTILELFWPFSALIMDYVFNHNYLTPVQIVAALVLLWAFFQVSYLDKPKIAFTARVIRGQGRGRELGFPTANLDKTDLDMPHGIYLADIVVKGENYRGLLHFGFKDVFNEPPSLEILIQDFHEDIYGQEVQVTVGRKLREVKKFASPELLAAAVREDLKALSS
ncbi:MAG: riboflavin kinase [Patescibacteria group bacterium]